MDVWAMIDDERSELSELCDALTPAQWDQPSLCSEWRVRDVIGHVVEVAGLTAPRLVAKLVRYGFRLNTMITQEAINHGTETSVDDMRAEVRATVRVRRSLPGVKPPGVLAGEMIHQQDVRRAVGMDRTIDPVRLQIALDELHGTAAGILPGKKRAGGLHLKALDLDWQAGEPTSPAVEGPGEALLMAMAGRAAALEGLTGPGVDVMRSRT